MKALRKRVAQAEALNSHERTLVGIATQLRAIKTSIENMKVQVDADSDYTAGDKTLLAQASNLVNNAKYTDFADFIETALG